MEKRNWEVPEGVSKARADKLLSDAHEAFSRADFHRAFEQGLVLKDGQAIAKKEKLSAGDVLEFSMPEPIQSDLSPVDLNLDIVFEDPHIVVVNKAAGLVTHHGAGLSEPTLVNGLLYHCRGQLSGIGGVERPGIVHRLDRETSGLILAAKTDSAHRAFSEMFQSRELKKEYLALVKGVPDLLSGSVKRAIERHPVQRHKMRVCKEGEGREAHTDWKLEKTFEKLYSLLRCRIHTGRTHQIRVHLLFIKHPILGDATYGYRKLSNLPSEPKRVMLHSERLAFTHPLTNEELDLRAPAPGDFKAFLD